jgi:hypothetical protein
MFLLLFYAFVIYLLIDFLTSQSQTGKLFTARGMEMLERVGKETMELIIDETGMEVEKSTGEGEQQTEEEPFEEVSFDRCFYIYGGPDQLEV